MSNESYSLMFWPHCPHWTGRWLGWTICVFFKNTHMVHPSHHSGKQTPFAQPESS